jgi:hypothetical protein
MELIFYEMAKFDTKFALMMKNMSVYVIIIYIFLNASKAKIMFGR